MAQKLPLIFLIIRQVIRVFAPSALKARPSGVGNMAPIRQSICFVSALWPIESKNEP